MVPDQWLVRLACCQHPLQYPDRSHSAAGFADRTADAIARRTADSLVKRGVRAVCPAPWHTAADGARDRADGHAMFAVMAAVLGPDDVAFLDIGAHEGQELSHAVRIAPEGPPRGVGEPIPGSPRSSASGSVGRGPHGGARRFGRASACYLPERSGQSGFKERNFPEAVTKEWIEVETERLDDALDPSVGPLSSRSTWRSRARGCCLLAEPCGDHMKCITADADLQ